MGIVEVKVFFYGFLKELAGQREVSVSLPEGASLQNLIDRLGEEFGEELKRNLQADLQNDLPIITVVGGSDYRFAGGLESGLEDKTPVYFIPPAMGG